MSKVVSGDARPRPTTGPPWGELVARAWHRASTHAAQREDHEAKAAAEADAVRQQKKARAARDAYAVFVREQCAPLLGAVWEEVKDALEADPAAFAAHRVPMVAEAARLRRAKAAAAANANQATEFSLARVNSAAARAEGHGAVQGPAEGDAGPTLGEEHGEELPLSVALRLAQDAMPTTADGVAVAQGESVIE